MPPVRLELGEISRRIIRLFCKFMHRPDEFPHRAHFHHSERFEEGALDQGRSHGGAAQHMIQETRREVRRIVVQPLQAPHHIDEGLLWARADW